MNEQNKYYLSKFREYLAQAAQGNNRDLVGVIEGLKLEERVVEPADVGPGEALVKSFHDVIEHIIKDSIENNRDLRKSSKILLLGVFNTSGIIEEEARQTIHAITDIVVEDTVKYQGDTPAAVKGLLDGIVEFAKEERLNREAAVDELATAAVNKAKEVDPRVEKQLRETFESNDFKGIDITYYQSREKKEVNEEHGSSKSEQN